MRFKNKSIFALLVIFVLVASVATIYAQTANLGSLSFTVPEDITVDNTNDTGFTLKNDEGDKIIADENINTESLVTSYLQDQGYSLEDTYSGEKTTYDMTGSSSSSYSYTLQEYSGNGAYAFVYLFEKDGESHALIGFTDSVDDDSDISIMADEIDGMDDIMDAIMQS